MITRDEPLCNKLLDFSEEQPWSEILPGYRWGRLALTPCDSRDTLDLKANNTDFVAIFTAIYPRLSFIELARLHRLLAEDELSHSTKLTESDWAHLFKSYGYQLNESLRKSLRLAAKLPEQFQTWCHQRSVAARDLAPLVALKDIALIEPFLAKIVSANLKKNAGIPIVELTCDLILMEVSSNRLTQQFQSEPKYWIQNLKCLRYPMTSEKDSTLNSMLESAPQPQNIKCNWNRQGDSARLNINFSAQNPKEMLNKLEALKKWTETLAETWR